MSVAENLLVLQIVLVRAGPKTPHTTKNEKNIKTAEDCQLSIKVRW